MATRSRIGVMHGDVVKHVYCHWDGYLAHNGDILFNHYDSVKANELVALGDVSSLRPNIGEKHHFSMFEAGLSSDEYDKLYGEMTTFYHRDRGEDNAKDWKVSHSFEDFLEHVDGCGGEWYYIMKDGVWYCGNLYQRDARHYRNLVQLVESLEIEMAAEAV
jgi:hypothetical protein